MTTENKANTEIWDKLFETPPQHTKAFKKGGGFSGTAIAPTYVVKRMTETFGPHGIGWGWEIIDEAYVDGAPLTDPEGVLTDTVAVVHKILLRLWYMSDDSKYYVGPHFGQTTFVGANKNGFYTDEEHAKKSVTDAVGKCVVQLGLSADVHMGLYDDNKYILAMHEKFDGNGSDAEEGDKGTKEVSDGRKVTPAQVKRLKAIKSDFEWTDEAAKELIKGFGYTTSTEIEKWEDYAAIVKELQKGMDGKAKADEKGYCTFVNGKPKERKN